MGGLLASAPLVGTGVVQVQLSLSELLVPLLVRLLVPLLVPRSCCEERPFPSERNLR